MELNPVTEMMVYPNLWEEQVAAGLTPLGRLKYRSNLLGVNRRIANSGGGNTSSKVYELDHLGREFPRSSHQGKWHRSRDHHRAGFAGLRLDELLPLRERISLSDEDMVDHLLRCGVDPRQPRPSIETLLHAFIPADFVDHTHPDPVIALTCLPEGREVAADVFGEEAIWIDYVRPGFALSKVVFEQLRDHASARFVLLAKHGLVAWGDTDKEAYEATLEAVRRVDDALEDRVSQLPFGGAAPSVIPARRRRDLLVSLLPVLRGALSAETAHVLKTDESDAVLEFVGAPESPRLSQIGAACPDHLVHTKVQPLGSTRAARALMSWRMPSP